jgi:hypothetical protein
LLRVLGGLPRDAACLLRDSCGLPRGAGAMPCGGDGLLRNLGGMLCGAGGLLRDLRGMPRGAGCLRRGAALECFRVFHLKTGFLARLAVASAVFARWRAARVRLRRLPRRLTAPARRAEAIDWRRIGLD